MSESELIKKIQKKDKQAIKELYIRYAPVMLAICIRYCGNREDAKDIMHENFIKILTNIGKYTGSGSFEGWMKRIMVNASLDYYKSKRKNETIQLNENHEESEEDESIFDDGIDKKDINIEVPNAEIIKKADFSKEEIIESLEEIPEKYKIIFSLNVIENYTHIEIAQMLGFDEKVSRTRLFRAKEMIKKILYQKSIERVTR